MVICLDYDGTYTSDPKMWDTFIAIAKAAGHEVICITMRYPNKAEEIDRNKFKISKLYYTSRQAKRSWAKNVNINVDIWIDDKPQYIFDNAAGYML